MLETPDHGFGSSANPCIDCKILMLRKAKKIMEKEKASFVLTGEVLGERPMSQRKEALNIIKRESMLEGRLVRPLSARLLRPTIPEEEGVIDREKLLDISGRSREKQLLLARKYRIRRFFPPAGGCLLAEKIFGGRVKDLIKNEGLDPVNMELSKYGRHFRLDANTKVILGRNYKENKKIISMRKKKDVLLRMKDAAGPYALVRGSLNSENLEKAGSIVAGFSKKKSETEVRVEILGRFWKKKVIAVRPMGREAIEERMM